MVNCKGKPSYYSTSGVLMFNTKGVCARYPNDCKTCAEMEVPPVFFIDPLDEHDTDEWAQGWIDWLDNVKSQKLRGED